MLLHPLLYAQTELQWLEYQVQLCFRQLETSINTSYKRLHRKEEKENSSESLVLMSYYEQKF